VTSLKNGLHWAKLQPIKGEKAQGMSLFIDVSNAMCIYVKIGLVLTSFIENKSELMLLALK
jgi:hypothetical protein